MSNGEMDPVLRDDSRFMRGGSWFTTFGWYIWWSDQSRAGPEPGFREIGFRLALRKGERAMTSTRSEDHA